MPPPGNAPISIRPAPGARSWPYAVPSTRNIAARKATAFLMTPSLPRRWRFRVTGSRGCKTASSARAPPAAGTAPASESSRRMGRVGRDWTGMRVATRRWQRDRQQPDAGRMTGGGMERSGRQENSMAEKTYWDSFKAEGENVVNKIKAVIHEGNVRRVVIQQEGRTVAEFPLTAGVVGAVLAPVLAAIGALVALLQDCTIQVERAETKTARPEQPTSAPN